MNPKDGFVTVYRNAENIVVDKPHTAPPIDIGMEEIYNGTDCYFHKWLIIN
jgi:hypothetical protein